LGPGIRRRMSAGIAGFKQRWRGRAVLASAAAAMRRRPGARRLKYMKGLLYLLAGGMAVAWLGLVAWAYWPSGVATVPARELAGEEDRFVTVDGLELRYRTWGEPAPGRP